MSERDFASRLSEAYINVLSVPIAIVLAPLFAFSRVVDDARALGRARARERELRLITAGIRAQGRHAVSEFEEDLQSVSRLKLAFLRFVTNEREAQIAFELMQLRLDGLMKRRSVTPRHAREDGMRLSPTRVA